jgi:hypothetical protein
VPHQLLIQGDVFWILIDRSLLIQDSKLVYGGISMRLIDVLSSGLKAKECLSTNEIRSGSLLGGIYFGIFIGVPLIYRGFIL